MDSFLVHIPKSNVQHWWENDSAFWILVGRVLSAIGGAFGDVFVIQRTAGSQNMPDTILENLRKEISETQKRREKLQLLKIAFVSALLGFGGSELRGFGSLYQALYVVPLIATFFDLLIQGEQFSIRRAGAFLRNCSSPLEQAYERFVSRNRDVFFNYGSTGFTSLSYFASVVLLRSSNHLHFWVEWLWFALLFAIFVSSIWYGRRRLKALDRIKSISLDEGVSVKAEKGRGRGAS